MGQLCFAERPWCHSRFSTNCRTFDSDIEVYIQDSVKQQSLNTDIIPFTRRKLFTRPSPRQLQGKINIKTNQF